MNIIKRSIVGVVALVALTGFATTASAATEWCIALDDGEEICFPIFVEKIPIKVGPPDPGPYAVTDIAELVAVLRDRLDPSVERWVLTDGLGERAFVMDMQAGSLYEVPQQQAGF